MHEVFPIVAGLAVGVVVQQLRDSRLKSAALAVLCAMVGVIAWVISGELLLSWGYLAFDSGQALLGALVVTSFLAWRKRRRV